MKQGDFVKLYKVSDDVFNGNHPNFIYEGYTQYGTVDKDLTVGERFNVIGRGFNDYLSTSTVMEILDDNTFKTRNSTYRVEKCEQPWQ